mgnify:CR=1 FL=1
MIPIRNIPPKKAAMDTQCPREAPSSFASDAWAEGIISMKDMYIITPAEKPREMARAFVLVCFRKKARKLPTPVARPANRVRRKAVRTLENSIILLSSIFLFTLPFFFFYGQRVVLLFFFIVMFISSVNPLSLDLLLLRVYGKVVILICPKQEDLLC